MADSADQTGTGEQQQLTKSQPTVSASLTEKSVPGEAKQPQQQSQPSAAGDPPLSSSTSLKEKPPPTTTPSSADAIKGGVSKKPSPKPRKRSAVMLQPQAPVSALASSSVPEEATTVGGGGATTSTSIGVGSLTRKELHPHPGQDGHKANAGDGSTKASTAAAVIAGPSYASRTIMNGMR